MNGVTQPYSGQATPGAAAAPAAWRPWQIAAAAGLFLAGLWCLRFQLQGLWALWTNDGLRSIGMVLPPLSLWLALRAWNAESWAQGGTWWGLAPLALALGLAAGSDAGAAPLALSLNWHTGMAAFDLAPPGLLLCAYASGTVLLFGGARAWREAAFPLLLLLLVNPVPRAFNALLDLPLQHFAAQSARAFAALLQVPVSEGTLRMMFAPQLGMFIAPGCDGLRGAAAMGYLALISGYLYRLPRLRWAGFVAGAVLLAYLFNLLRLCGVVMYYWVALRVPAVGDYGVQVDYAIGGTLFCAAAAFLLGLPRRWSAA